MEEPSRERVLAGDGMYYDAEGNSMARCCGCMGAIDLQFGDYVEVWVSRKSGPGMEGGKAWRWCGGCAPANPIIPRLNMLFSEL